LLNESKIMEIEEKIKIMLKSGIYNFNVLAIKTGISRYFLNKIVNNETVPGYIYIALNDYFIKIGYTK